VLRLMKSCSTFSKVDSGTALHGNNIVSPTYSISKENGLKIAGFLHHCPAMPCTCVKSSETTRNGTLERGPRSFQKQAYSFLCAVLRLFHRHGLNSVQRRWCLKLERTGFHSGGKSLWLCCPSKRPRTANERAEGAAVPTKSVL
jgi:hypothetical protein